LHAQVPALQYKLQHAELPAHAAPIAEQVGPAPSGPPSDASGPSEDPSCDGIPPSPGADADVELELLQAADAATAREAKTRRGVGMAGLVTTDARPTFPHARRSAALFAACGCPHGEGGVHDATGGSAGEASALVALAEDREQGQPT
jgi:hypothetical protein